MNRVLVVEPDRPLQAELLGAVRGAGYEGVAAADADAAVRALRDLRFDAVVLDVSQAPSLPDVERVVRAARGGAVIATSAAPSPELAIGSLRLGARAILRKPLALPELEAALGSAVRGDVPVPPLLASRDPAMQRVLDRARRAAATDATLVLVGESGTGKDLLARYVHARSARRTAALGVVDCALPFSEAAEPLRELDAGGAAASLHGGTLLLHRVLEASPELQARLVGLLQARDLAAAPGGLDVRVIATSPRELGEPEARVRLRRDLRLRLDVQTLRIPPLRERPLDIPLLARELVSRLSAAGGQEPAVLCDAALELLSRHRFRGNVRELENLMRRAVLWYPGQRVDAEALLAGASPRAPESELEDETLDLRALEKRALIRSLERSGGNRTRASAALGISPRTLRNKLRRHGLS